MQQVLRFIKFSCDLFIILCLIFGQVFIYFPKIFREINIDYHFLYILLHTLLQNAYHQEIIFGTCNTWYVKKTVIWPEASICLLIIQKQKMMFYVSFRKFFKKFLILPIGTKSIIFRLLGSRA